MEDLRMKLRYGLALASALTLSLGACASGGGGGGSSSAAVPAGPGGEVLAQGEDPRDDDFTEMAEDALGDITPEMGDAEARPLYEAAAVAAEQAIQADPTNPKAHYLSAQAQLGLDDYAAAAAALDEAERLRPIYALETERIRENAWIEKYQEAAPLVNAGEYEESIRIFEQANAIYRERPEVMLTLGQVYAQTGQYDEAVENLQAAQEIINSERTEQMDSATAESWRQQGADLPVMIAQTLVQAEQYDEAAVALEGLLAEDPENVAYLRTLGSTLIRMEQPDSAQAVFNRILEIDGLPSSDYYQVGIGLYQAEEYVQAADAFEKAAGASVNDRDALEMWSRSLIAAYPTGEDAPEPPAGALEEIVSTSERWMELDPNNRNAYLILAQTANRLGDEARASDLVGQIEEFQVSMDNLQLQRGSRGGGLVVGAIRNVAGTPGATATIEVTFYDAAGGVLAVEEAMVQLPAVDTTADFRVDLDTDAYIGGYSYEVRL
jgi:tetratricopeptide (TPR) repeat protein